MKLKKKSKTIPGPLFKGHEVTQDETDFDKDKKVSSTVEGRTSHPLLDTPPKLYLSETIKVIHTMRHLSQLKKS